MASGAKDEKRPCHTALYCASTLPWTHARSERRHMTWANTEAIRRRLLHAVRMGLSIHFSCLLRACKVLHVVFRC